MQGGRCFDVNWDVADLNLNRVDVNETGTEFQFYPALVDVPIGWLRLRVLIDNVIEERKYIQ